MTELLQSLLGPDLKSALLVIFNLILIESLLSVDNAAVLATMVMDLPERQRKKALKYGIIGAYLFRGLCLLFASFLINFAFLKGLGGLYLMYLTFSYFRSKKTETIEDDTLNKSENKIYKYTLGLLGPFWATVAMVELMDLAFSIDNVFAAVALVNGYPDDYKMNLVYIGVFIGILAMRFVAQTFVNLMQRFPFLESSAFLVIGVLGLKLVVSFACDFFYKKGTDACLSDCEKCNCYPDSGFCEFLNGHTADLMVSLITLGIFFIPIVTSILFNYPSKEPSKG
ncbi:MAG: TerC family protein [Cytophagaceae bacterium]|nr:TerC family protein [Cytophagaceae bacterium]MDW8456121.1 TerC family protein [Cytophagaceae bacterium]